MSTASKQVSRDLKPVLGTFSLWGIAVNWLYISLFLSFFISFSF